ncbi:iron uptake transporter permease EfeU [Flexivirga caeni]|uniref:Iron permease n=1 Tax=Flexivirga caeni TaxID=2294115 RepID=A0A3M9M9A2_9MICO|nr:iron uptake transporter permease EfeU [Flexivirga caeni]RNI21138.1 iron permease [Flexivirga caeni]
MNWADAIPNLLIGLREGLEAGLVVSILLAAVQKAPAAADGTTVRTRPVWLGVLGAVCTAICFAAVLTYSTEVLSSSAQEAVGGLLSVLAVVLITSMIFWMKRTARTLSGKLKGEVSRALAIGAGALTLTAFLAVGREGLETTLFIWTAAKASGSTVAPLLGALVGLAIAVLLCWLLCRRAVKINLGVFFNRTAIALIVIAAGVLAYGLGDLQDAGWLPGARWIAFDLSAHIDPTSWWVTLISGVTELTPRMTVLQVVCWVVYLAVVLPAFLLFTGTAAAPADDASEEPGRWERLVGTHVWSVATALIVTPIVVAAAVIAVIPRAAASTTTSVRVDKTHCGADWTSGHSGTQTFQVTNSTSHAGEINLDNSSGAVVAEIETLGPATTAAMSASLTPGTYQFVCLMAGGALRGPQVQVTGKSSESATLAFKPVTLADITAPNKEYQVYAAGVLRQLRTDAGTLRSDLAAGNTAAAKRAWLTAQLDWERVGASYDSFGDEGLAVDGLPDGYVHGVNDPQFTGLHRIEYWLYHGASPKSLVPVADRLLTDIGTVQHKLTTDDEAGNPTNLPLRVHEIIEDALRDHLSGLDDPGAHAAYAMTYADTQVDEVVLTEVAPLVQERDPGLVSTARSELATLQHALDAAKVNGHWASLTGTPLAKRQAVNGAIGQLLETLSVEPNLLEVPPAH